MTISETQQPPKQKTVGDIMVSSQMGRGIA